MNIAIYKYWGKLLTEAITKAYAKGVKSVPEFNKEKILGLKKTKKFASYNDKPLFEVNWADTDKELLRNFTVEAFTVAAVNSYELEEKLKELAVDLMKQNKLGDKELWKAEAYNIMLQYIPEDESVPPPNYLQTNLQTAINSAYHGSRYQRLKDLQDVYTHWQYKTQADAAVRDEHRILHDKIWRSNDPIWDEIYPPNGWNCRCYINPMTIEEVSSSGVETEKVIDEEARTELLNRAKVPKEFRRNSGEIRSIWGKWLQSKFTDKVYNEITSRLKGYANQMPDADKVIENLNKNAAPFRKLEYSKENWKKEFPEGKVKTPLPEELKFGNDFFDKMKRENRTELFGLVKPIFETPEYIIVDDQNGTLFLKAFKKDKTIIYAGVQSAKDEVIISVHPKGNVKNKVRNGKLLIYSFRRESGDSGGEQKFTHVASRANFTNINKNELKINTYGELWGEIIAGKVYKSVLRKIIYKITGIEVEVIKDGKIKTVNDDYSNINKYRIGVLIEQLQ